MCLCVCVTNRSGESVDGIRLVTLVQPSCTPFEGGGGGGGGGGRQSGISS